MGADAGVVIRAALLLALAVPASAAQWAVVPAQSALGFQATWVGKVVSGRFSRWQAAIDFDPAKPQTARIAATVDLASARTGEETVDGALPGVDWFASGQGQAFARFVGSRVTQTGPGRYVMAGTLTMRGVSAPVTMPFTLTVAGDTAMAAGSVRVDRRAWKIGLQADAPGQWVAFPVTVTMKLVAKRR